MWRCWRCGNIQAEEYVPPLPVVYRTNANILYVDVEVSKSVVYNYGLKVPSKYLNPDDLIHEYYIICWSASYVGHDKVFSDCVTSVEAKNWSDKNILKQLRDLMAATDIIAGHNVDAYDLKRLNTRFLLNGLSPVGDKKTLDTLKIARSKFSFESNRLGYISDRLGFKGKDHIDNSDWLKIVNSGDAATLRKVLKYNIQDVRIGKKVLQELMKYSGRKTDYGAVKLDDMRPRQK